MIECHPQNQIQFTWNTRSVCYPDWYSLSLMFVRNELYSVMRCKGRMYWSYKMITTNNDTDPHNLESFSKHYFWHIQCIDGFLSEWFPQMCKPVHQLSYLYCFLIQNCGRFRFTKSKSQFDRIYIGTSWCIEHQDMTRLIYDARQFSTVNRCIILDE